MKEITYEDWIKNPTPRIMWVWDDDENRKRKEKVVYISELDEQKKVVSVFQDSGMMFCELYKHCAEIKEETTRLTWYELNQLLKCFGVEYTDNNNYIYNNDVLYEHNNNNKEVFVNYKIRYKQGEWEEPTRETVWKWWGEETPDSGIARLVSFMDWDME